MSVDDDEYKLGGFVFLSAGKLVLLALVEEKRLCEKSLRYNCIIIIIIIIIINIHINTGTCL